MFAVTREEDTSLLVHFLTLTLDSLFRKILKTVAYHFYYDSKEPPELATCQIDKNAFSYRQDT